MELTFYLAADTFLYLPLSIVKEYNILKSLIGEDVIVNFKYGTEENDSKEIGDVWAVKEMVKANKKISENSISIAISDPTTLFTIDSVNEDRPVILGALIDKLPFWAISGLSDEISKEEFLDYEKIYHYSKEFVTAYSIAHEIDNINKKDISPTLPVKFGEEVQLVKNGDNCMAISADIASVAKGVNEGSIYINYSYALEEKDKNLTTGIITTHRIIKKHPEMLSKILEAIQKSIFIFYTSKELANQVAQNILLSDSDLSGSMNEEDQKEYLSWIIDRIRGEKLYPNDLRVSKDLWKLTVNRIKKIFDKKDSFYRYDNYTNTKLVLESEKSIAMDFGIDSDTLGLKSRTFRIAQFLDPAFSKQSMVLIVISSLLLLISCSYYWHCLENGKVTYYEIVIASGGALPSFLVVIGLFFSIILKPINKIFELFTKS